MSGCGSIHKPDILITATPAGNDPELRAKIVEEKKRNDVDLKGNL